jgi:alkanesulfonate monooxygenase SsuD/methylene tetrahydromethanopterin reductase-like flavin-dependent oxidoreductase (luciferase family)
MAAIVLWSRANDMTRFGIALPTAPVSGQPSGASSLADAAQAAEAAGFASAWAFDSVGRGALRFDPLMALAVAATVTRGLELGTGIIQVPLRNPVELAQRVLTAHLVSGGRLLLGVGAGSTAGDFAALGLDFETRFRRLDESLAVMRRLWAGESVNGASLAPVWPAVLGGPPILIGSWAGSKWIERAAREFDGWVGSGARSSWRSLREGIARFRGFGGKRAVVTNVRVALDSPTASASGPDDPFDLKCPREIARERLHLLREWGYDDIVLVPERHEAGHFHELRELAQSSQ